MNRHKRRASESMSRRAGKKLKLRCMCCDRTGKEMSKEHFWPRWLIDRARMHKEEVDWNGQWINPKAATVPICVDCNQALGTELEGPASVALEDMEAGRGLSDAQAELLVRWLWKFEGLAWCGMHPSGPVAYSALWSMRDRVLGTSMTNIRRVLMLAVSFFEENDKDFTGLPMGLDSFVGGLNSVFVSGVFCNTAMMVLLDRFAGLVPPEFSVYKLNTEKEPSGAKVFFPKTGFKTAQEAINATKRASGPLGLAHEQFAAERNSRPGLILPSRRVELP